LSLEPLEERAVPTTLVPGVDRNTTASLGGSLAESTVAVDPTNPNRMFSVSNSFNFRYSTDQGVTWNSSSTAGITGSCCDNQAAWDRFGNLFVTYINSSLNSVVLVRSTNGGQSFTTVFSSVQSGVDQPSIAVGPSGPAGTDSVWIDWTTSTGMRATGATVTGLGSALSFAAVKSINSGASADFGGIAVSNTGAVIVTYQNNTGSTTGPSTIFTATDPTNVAGNFNAPVAAATSNVGGFTRIPAQPHRSIDVEANVAADHSHAMQYLVYTDRPSTSSNSTKIYLRVSTNNGASWGAAQQVNDDASANSHFNDAVAVDQTNGDLAVTWYDCRNSAGNNTAQIYGTVRTFGSSSFLASVPLATALSNGAGAPGGFDFGDYDTMDFDHGAFVRTWADNSSPSDLTPANTSTPSQKIGFCRVVVQNTTQVVDHFQVTTTVGTATAGAPFNVTVTAKDASNNTVTGYNGTITFSSQDPYGATFNPASYTFVAGDQGTHTFVNGATLYTSGTEDVTVRAGAISGTTNVVVNPGPGFYFWMDTPASASSGVPFSFTAYAFDAYLNYAYNYVTPPSAQVIFYTTTDPQASLPADYQFTAADQGAHTFNGVVYFAQGTNDIQCYDSSQPAGGGYSTIEVGPSPPHAAASGGRAAPAGGADAAAARALAGQPGRAAAPGGTAVAAAPAADVRVSQQAVADQVFTAPAPRKDWYTAPGWHPLAQARPGAFGEWDFVPLGSDAGGTVLL
jgi:hypothetical protein